MLLLASCSSEPVKNQAHLETRPQSKPQRPKRAAAPVKSYGLADNQASQHLLNADTLIQSGNSPAAQKELDLIKQADLSAEQRSKLSLLEAQMALNMGDAEQALNKLQITRPKLLATPDQISFYQSLAFAHSLMGNVLPGVSARIKLGSLLQSPKQQQENIVTILDLLSVLPMETLDAQPAIADELSGWMALAKVLKQRNQAGFDVGEEIRQWRQVFPNHPANAEFLQAYLATPQPASQPMAAEQAPGQPADTGAMIAVLLPASGSYAQAGKAIKEGLSVAHRLAASAAPQSALKFYDTEETDITSLYNKAVAEGAKQVIGPLLKEQIETLALNAELTVPVLALNHVEHLSKTNLYQFGLSPVDEAEQLALKARRDGRQSAVLLVPDNSYGQRIGQYLASAWQSQGGIIAGMQSYDPKQHNIASQLNTLLATDPRVQNQPQTILLSASPEIGRELAPQLKYHQGGDLAVYAMPNIYSGRQNPIKDTELGAINFCDIPWLFADAYSGPLSQSALQSTWQALPDSATRLVALGVDAYNLLGQLHQLATTPYAGATGRLSLNGENQITRKLVCAQFKAGMPVSTGYVE
ncbi:MAG: penicillin-binding protein activator [Methylococcaceae bacterium]|nr:penicillin-binding protein activator [Methylococcaceae bacterium]